ncbi:2-hydroxyacid dehydrogenase [Pararhizobium mangrovi]|uniref:2-hydroxyacid dehydrogenase n=1 Tax=Pararhizobium mangrovi TaxID=2590452 RepID=A0A506UFQ2_9HYPH|nr:2-hydroxyacid dehydrogenase [Pararhizobium mangrovi]TPW30677.1 2-hydroxyacid dehydrogenase [Pararhizobium mangrovi]
MSEGSEPTILIPGKVHPRVRERVEAEFAAVAIETADAALITPELAASIRGIASSTRIDAAFIDALPNLEIIAHFGVGYDPVDAGHAARCGVVVTNTPDVLSDEVADTTIGLLINTVRELPRAETYLRAGRWASEGGYRLTPLTLRGRTVGIFGLGRIGRAIARRLEGFGVEILYHSRSKREDVSYAYAESLKDLAERCDTLIVIVPGGPATDRAVDAEILSALGSNGVLVNVGRGSTVDCDALETALSNGTIAAAGLDVFPNEPKVPEGLTKLDNVSLLPHVASASQHTRNAMADLLVDNLAGWFDRRRPVTPVPESGELVSTRH